MGPGKGEISEQRKELIQCVRELRMTVSPREGSGEARMLWNIVAPQTYFLFQLLLACCWISGSFSALCSHTYSVEGDLATVQEAPI